MLRWLKTVVVSDEEKAPVRCQVGIRKTSVSESLLTCRNKDSWHQNRGIVPCLGMSLAGARWLARRCPAWRRREPDLLLLDGTWEGVLRHFQRSSAGETGFSSGCGVRWRTGL